jgi:hypothetical protein
MQDLNAIERRSFLTFCLEFFSTNLNNTIHPLVDPVPPGSSPRNVKPEMPRKMERRNNVLMTTTNTGNFTLVKTSQKYFGRAPPTAPNQNWRLVVQVYNNFSLSVSHPQNLLSSTLPSQPSSHTSTSTNLKSSSSKKISLMTKL